MVEKQQEEPMNIRSKEKDRLREKFYKRDGFCHCEGIMAI